MQKLRIIHSFRPGAQFSRKYEVDVTSLQDFVVNQISIFHKLQKFRVRKMTILEEYNDRKTTH